MSEYVANGNMYGCSNTFSNPLVHKAKLFKTSVNELYEFMLKRLLSKYSGESSSLEFSLLLHMQKEMHESNSLQVILYDDAYYFDDYKSIRRIDKYESS